MVGTPQRLREYIAESARKIFQVTVAAILVRNGNDYRLETVSADPQAAMGKTALLSHVRSFAMQATEQEKLLDFKFSYRELEEEVYYGLAQPLVESVSGAVLLVVRSTAFAPAEVGAFGVLGSVTRLALESAESVSLFLAEKRDLDQLLEISAELGSAPRLDTFLPKFVVRAAEFLGFERAFVAVMETDECAYGGERAKE